MNVDGFYNSLLCFIDKAVDEGFIKPSARQIILSAQTPYELLCKLEDYVPKHDESEMKLSWEKEHIGAYASKPDISR